MSNRLKVTKNIELVNPDLFRFYVKKIEKHYFVTQQAMVTLRGMAEHSFSNVYNYQHFTSLGYTF